MLLLVSFIGFLVFLAGLSNSIMDTISFHYDSSIFAYIKSKSLKTFFNPTFSWMLKWKWLNGKRIELTKAPWYYLFLFNPGYVESFPYSSTILVLFTDAWHLFKTIFITCFELIISTLLSICLVNDLDFIIILGSFITLKILFSISFELFWDYIWLKKK